MTKNKKIEVNLLELITLNEIKLRNRKSQIDTANNLVSLFKQVSKLSPDTSIGELKKIQLQLKSMMKKTEKELEVIEDDKKFVRNIMKRGCKK